jgi:hypothetical protein
MLKIIVSGWKDNVTQSIFHCLFFFNGKLVIILLKWIVIYVFMLSNITMGLMFIYIENKELDKWTSS